SFIPSSRHAAVVGAVRDWKGRLLGAYTANLGSCFITHVELREAVESLRMTWQLDYQRMALHMDSIGDSSILQANEEPSHQHPSLMLQFHNLFHQNCIVTISHVFRGNFLTDCLVRRGFSIPFRVHFFPLMTLRLTLNLV
ncbi:Putative ribonuclease H protein At1g65750, partial [Linum grandiflorum]